MQRAARRKSMWRETEEDSERENYRESEKADFVRARFLGGH
jgi:hypothetical protein